MHKVITIFTKQNKNGVGWWVVLQEDYYFRPIPDKTELPLFETVANSKAQPTEPNVAFCQKKINLYTYTYINRIRYQTKNWQNQLECDEISKISKLALLLFYRRKWILLRKYCFENFLQLQLEIWHFLLTDFF